MLVGILVLALHVGLGLLAAHRLWTGSDDPHQWMYFYGTGGCCIAPVTGAVGAFLTNNPRFKAIGIGMMTGVALALIAATVGWAINFIPSWAS
ncbi:hypothetical protein ACWT_5417 [Actinoplanes sp. SE50]|nr:hypothetical protein ACPL_5547 [Actinoplanes sp. SE50/110]ATO84832.1 hypothetical protein ACWT_5417 [Actinoplanes sp. SE50]SLM02242.1 hypothetical protein ACSP50_5480 [Actinoplanes sp. SE50/110]